MRSDRDVAVHLTSGGNGFANPRYRIVVGIEITGLIGGLVVINAAINRPKFVVAWIALVVGTDSSHLLD